MIFLFCLITPIPAMTTAIASNTAISAAQVLLRVETQYLVGRFRVPLSQIEPHPVQCQLSSHWVDSLHEHFVKVGIDRVAHPIKAVLKHPQSPDTPFGNDPNAEVHSFPSHLGVLVYHGQHRVAACRRMMDVQEHWWICEVYRPGEVILQTYLDMILMKCLSALEHDHPAEFLTLMHMGNEDQHRLSTSDADRFLALHRLTRMHRDKLIATEVYEVNRTRIIRAVVKDATRQGLTNLVASDELADSIAVVLEHPCLHAAFNASTWGKKLVKGRFYKVAACLVDEMLEQCRLLWDSQIDISDKPFLLPASCCNWNQLEVAVKKKDHAWKELPGGAAAALSRVRQRNPGFATFVNPAGSDDWTFTHTALLPTVLTSDTVFGCLQDMYLLAQHLIHFTAGPEHLAKYTASTASNKDEAHPAAILYKILETKLHGKESNYPHKIIQEIWTNRTALLAALKSARIPAPADTSREAYKTLLKDNELWWKLARMFKMSVLPGLGLVIPKVFGQSTADRQKEVLQAIREKRQTDSHADPAVNMAGQQDHGSSLQAMDQSHRRSPSLEISVPDRPDTVHNQPAVITTASTQHPSGTSRPQKRKHSEDEPDRQNTEHSRQHALRVSSQASSSSAADKDFMPSEQEAVLPLEAMPGTQELCIQRLVKRQLQEISNKVSEMPAADARVLHSLLIQLTELHGMTYCNRVMDALNQKVT
ncbi:hypothetical protein FRC10_008412, partial [Ceratobasidium sp. 414]